jgi:hypothetical protein
VASFRVNRRDHGTRLAASEPGPVQLNSASITLLHACESPGNHNQKKNHLDHDHSWRTCATSTIACHLLGAAGVAYGGPPGRVDGLGEVGVGKDDARVGRSDPAQVDLADAVHLALEEHEAAGVVVDLPVMRGDGPQDLRPPVRLHEDLRTLHHR